jgi:fatty-acyl-CoA synthase
MTLFDPVATHARSHPHQAALCDLETDCRFNYGQLDAAVDRLASWLCDELGAGSAARVGVLSKNCAEIVILHLACVRAGAIFVPLNWRLAPAEIELLVQDASPALLFLEAEFVAPKAISRLILIAETLALGKQGSRPPKHARLPFEATTTLLYSSGTSGRPKGVMLSESNVFWGCANFIYGCDVTRTSVFLCDMPLFHTAGLMAATRVPIQAGGCVLLTRGFDPPKTLQRLSDPSLRVTHYFSVPQMAARLWNEPGFQPESLHNLVAWAIGGAPNPKALSERLVNAGIRISEGFGMSESCSNFGMPTQDLDLLRRKAGSSGLPFMTVEAKIVDENGEEVADGDVGELLMRGPCVTSGYWNQPEVTAKAFRDGWFRTGDAARRDADGFYYIVDRQKDMYISGGENVYPAEVEAAIAELTAVAECAIVGVPDEQWGEVGRAYIVPVSGQTLTEADVRQHCLHRLAKYKIPKSIVITDILPRTASGKVQKHLLRHRALHELSAN